jgi:hypothetical protein
MEILQKEDNGKGMFYVKEGDNITGKRFSFSFMEVHHNATLFP